MFHDAKKIFESKEGSTKPGSKKFYFVLQGKFAEFYIPNEIDMAIIGKGIEKRFKKDTFNFIKER